MLMNQTLPASSTVPVTPSRKRARPTLSAARSAESPTATVPGTAAAGQRRCGAHDHGRSKEEGAEDGRPTFQTRPRHRRRRRPCSTRPCCRVGPIALLVTLPWVAVLVRGYCDPLDPPTFRQLSSVLSNATNSDYVLLCPFTIRGDDACASLDPSRPSHVVKSSAPSDPDHREVVLTCGDYLEGASSSSTTGCVIDCPQTHFIVPARQRFHIHGVTLRGSHSTAVVVESGGRLRVTSSALVDNVNTNVLLQSTGGAIRGETGSAIIVDGNTKIWNNAAERGGGIDALGVLQLREVDFRNNLAMTTGGAIHVGGSGKVELMETTFYDNTARDAGPALYSESSSVTPVGERNAVCNSGGGSSSSSSSSQQCDGVQMADGTCRPFGTICFPGIVVDTAEPTSSPVAVPASLTPSGPSLAPTTSSSAPSATGSIVPSSAPQPVASLSPSTTTSPPTKTPSPTLTAAPSQGPTRTSPPTSTPRPTVTAPPTTSTRPSPQPSRSPRLTAKPTVSPLPSASPTISTMPSSRPSAPPSNATHDDQDDDDDDDDPTAEPTSPPASAEPTHEPRAEVVLTAKPSASPTQKPTKGPATQVPQRSPTARPTLRPTARPTGAPIRTSPTLSGGNVVVVPPTQAPIQIPTPRPAAAVTSSTPTPRPTFRRPTPTGDGTSVLRPTPTIPSGSIGGGGGPPPSSLAASPTRRPAAAPTRRPTPRRRPTRRPTNRPTTSPRPTKAPVVAGRRPTSAAAAAAAASNTKNNHMRRRRRRKR